MKKLLSLLFVLGLALSACGASPTQSAPPAQTSTPTLTPTETQTPIPPTSTVTPLPTIPTFTPTFDASTIVTVTPAEMAECPKEDPSLIPTFYVPKHPGCFDTDQCVFSGTENDILEFLNEGGTIQAAISKLKTAIYGDYQDYAYQDLT